MWDRLFEQIKKDKGKLDIVFANAGIAKYAPLATIDEEHFDSIFSRSCQLAFFAQTLSDMPEKLQPKT